MFNGNNSFNIVLSSPCCFTYINKNKTTDKIKCTDRVNNVVCFYDDIFQINKFSDTNVYPELERKIYSFSQKASLKSYINTNGNFYVNVSQIGGNVFTNETNKMVKDDFYTLVIKNGKVTNQPKMQYFGFDMEETANNFLTYVKSDFARFCLSIYKTNKNLHRGELEIVPYLDFTQEWTDEKLYKEFNLTQEEINFINTHIPKYY